MGQALETEKVYAHFWEELLTLWLLYSNLERWLRYGSLVGPRCLFQILLAVSVAWRGSCDSETRTCEEKLGDGLEKELIFCSSQQRHAVFRELAECRSRCCFSSCDYELQWEIHFTPATNNMKLYFFAVFHTCIWRELLRVSTGIIFFFVLNAILIFLRLKYSWHNISFRCAKWFDNYTHYEMLTVSVVTVCHYTTYYNIIDPLPFAVLFIPVASSFYSWSLNFLILFVCFASPLVSLPLGNHQFVLRVNESVNMKQYLSLLHGRHSNFYFIKKKCWFMTYWWVVSSGLKNT